MDAECWTIEGFSLRNGGGAFQANASCNLTLRCISPPCQITVAFKKDKFVVKVTDAMTIKEVKSHLEPLSGVPAGNQKLMYKSMLSDESTVGACALKVFAHGSHQRCLEK